MIEIETVGAVRVLTLSSGRVNAMNVELLKELTGALGELQRSGADPLVVTGAGRVFSAGVDLNRLVDGGADYTDRLVPALSEAFEAVFWYPGPTVAAINGAAIAALPAIRWPTAPDDPLEGSIDNYQKGRRRGTWTAAEITSLALQRCRTDGAVWHAIDCTR